MIEAMVPVQIISNQGRQQRFNSRTRTGHAHVHRLPTNYYGIKTPKSHKSTAITYALDDNKVCKPCAPKLLRLSSQPIFNKVCCPSTTAFRLIDSLARRNFTFEVEITLKVAAKRPLHLFTTKTIVLQRQTYSKRYTSRTDWSMPDNRSHPLAHPLQTHTRPNVLRIIRVKDIRTVSFVPFDLPPGDVVWSMRQSNLCIIS